MYEPMSNGTANRLPRSQSAPAAQPSNTLARQVGGALVQAAAIVVVAKVVDAVIESFVARRRAKQAQPSRHEQPIGV